ncbi:MAG: LptF/LptG family permease [Holosporaceae bacterium]|nr:LptF/LptG family permease [Holosporaceae bacterium]
MNKRLFRHIFHLQLTAMLFVSFFIFSLILLFDFAEIARKFPISNLEETAFAIKLSFLRTPNTFCEILHYIYFITATFTMWNLCHSHQITILKSSGRSPQQILYPFISCAFFISLVWLFLLHPLGQWSDRCYNKTVNPSFSSEMNCDIWIDYPKDNQIIFISGIVNNNIEGLHIYYLQEDHRIFAKNAEIRKNSWELRDVTVVKDGDVSDFDRLTLHNNISLNLLQILSSSPKKQDIYGLYKVYRIQHRDKVLLKAYELELHKLLANCANFILFALIAAVICFPINRYKTKTDVAVKMICIAVMLRFINNIFESMAYTGVLPVIVACWTVVLVLLCLAVSILVWNEA